MAVFDLRNTAVVLLYHLNLSSLSTSLTVISISKFRPLNGPHTGRRQRSREKPSTPNAPPPGRWPPAFPRPAPRPRVRRLAWLLGCCLRLSRRPLLASLSPRADRPGVPCLRRTCRLQPAHLVARRPLAAAAGAAGSLRNPSGIPEEVAVWAVWAISAYISVPDDRPAHVRRKTSRLTPIRHLRPADAGVCASRSGGGASDSKTLPEYSQRPACDGGGHCATAGTPTQHAA
jgi:hypothetical protein